MRSLKVLIAKGSSEAFEQTTEGLRKQMGEVIQLEQIAKAALLDIKTDPAAIGLLRMLAGQRQGDRIG